MKWKKQVKTTPPPTKPSIPNPGKIRFRSFCMFILHALLPSFIDWKALTFPTTLDDLKTTGDILKKYMNADTTAVGSDTSVSTEFKYRLLIAHVCTYIYLQAFGVPGTFFATF